MTDDWSTDLERFQALPRVTGLALSPEGGRLVTCVATLDPKKQKWVTAVWEVDPTGSRPARRLTRSAKGEGSPVFSSGGDVLFVSNRPDPDIVKDKDEEDKPALWLIGPSGEARQVGSRPGGIGSVRTAAGRVVVTSLTLPSSADDDEERRKQRRERKVSAVLHSGYPVRYWDHDLGPDEPRLLTADLAAEPLEWKDLTPAPGRALDEASFDVSPDGQTVVTTWSIAEPLGSRRTAVIAIDGAGVQRVLADDDEYEFGRPRVSPDGTKVVLIRNRRTTAHDPGDRDLVVVPLDGSTPPAAVTAWDRWPITADWSTDGGALFVTADSEGRCPVFRVDLDGGVLQLTTDDGAYTDVCVAADGSAVYALRAAVDAAPAPVRIDPSAPGAPVALRGPVEPLAVPGRLTEVTATAADGRSLRSWLAVPPGDGPHPLVLWIHGGPLHSWNAWSWRWCPWLLVARGYAVLLPDPALSTGYGLEMIRAGWGNWGGAPYDDLMRTTDAALQRDDVDADRTAAMGGSFGGYMANWIAGQTDRFRAIVTHASLWALDQFGPTTDLSWYWQREMTPEMLAKNNPAQFADRITTPMLVIHGDRDYRVPVGEALRLWWDLCSRAKDPATMSHRFLYFPDENHWVLTPNHSTVWYETVLAFLDQHVRGDDEAVPDLLR